MAEDEGQRLLEENTKLREDNFRKDQRIALLEQKLDALARRLFGVKSESLDPAQLELLLDPDAAKKAPSAESEGPGPAAEEPFAGGLCGASMSGGTILLPSRSLRYCLPVCRNAALPPLV